MDTVPRKFRRQISHPLCSTNTAAQPLQAVHHHYAAVHEQRKMSVYISCLLAFLAMVMQAETHKSINLVTASKLCHARFGQLSSYECCKTHVVPVWGRTFLCFSLAAAVNVSACELPGSACGAACALSRCHCAAPSLASPGGGPSAKRLQASGSGAEPACAAPSSDADWRVACVDGWVAYTMVDCELAWLAEGGAR